MLKEGLPPARNDFLFAADCFEKHLSDYDHSSTDSSNFVDAYLQHEDCTLPLDEA